MLTVVNVQHCLQRASFPHMGSICTLRRLRKEGVDSEVSRGYTARPCPKIVIVEE